METAVDMEQPDDGHSQTVRDLTRELDLLGRFLARSREFLTRRRPSAQFVAVRLGEAQRQIARMRGSLALL